MRPAKSRQSLAARSTVKPGQFQTFGRMAVIGDPTGSGLMIMQPLSTEQREEPKPGSVGTIGWNELHVGDLDVAWNFYSKMFGWTKGHSMDMGEMGTTNCSRSTARTWAA